MVNAYMQSSILLVTQSSAAGALQHSCCLQHHLAMTAIALQGPYVVNITAFASDPAPQGTQLMCLTVDFDIAPPQPPPAVEHLMDSIKRGAASITDSYKKQTA